MTTTETVPDVEVDESELTQRPCETFVWINRPCGKPSIGEDLVSCARGHDRYIPCCKKHLGVDSDNGGWICAACLPAVKSMWVVVSRLYTRAAS